MRERRGPGETARKWFYVLSFKYFFPKESFVSNEIRSSYVIPFFGRAAPLMFSRPMVFEKFPHAFSKSLDRDNQNEKQK